MVAKIGGTVWEVLNDIKDTLIAGVDLVTTEDKTAVVSLACQMGPNFVHHYSMVAKQKKGAQVMNSVYKMALDIVKHYQKKNGSLPKQILVFRKGINRSNFDDMVEFEIYRIAETLQVTYKTEAPKLIYLIVDTRVDERFAVSTQNGLENPDTGLVVIDGVVKRNLTNFYLVSQHANRGSINPT